jgi:hypothetical protein
MTQATTANKTFIGENFLPIRNTTDIRQYSVGSMQQYTLHQNSDPQR